MFRELKYFTQISAYDSLKNAYTERTFNSL